MLIFLGTWMVESYLNFYGCKHGQQRGKRRIELAHRMILFYPILIFCFGDKMIHSFLCEHNLESMPPVQKRVLFLFPPREASCWKMLTLNRLGDQMSSFQKAKMNKSISTYHTKHKGPMFAVFLFIWFGSYPPTVWETLLSLHDFNVESVVSLCNLE